MENSQKTGGAKDLKQAYRTAYLIAGFLKQTLTQEEKDELDDWILASDENMILFEKMTDEKNLAEANNWFKKINVEEDLVKTKKKLTAKKPMRLWPYIAAAAIIIAILVGIYFNQNSGNGKDSPPIAVKNQDMMPGSDKAILTLDDGKVIELRSDGSDTIINKQVKNLRKDGQLIYDSSRRTKELVYHTLSVPRKGQYKLTLPDGSKVWLNSESSIRYPVFFTGKERKVFVTGETYFEVAKDKDKPFRVVSGNITVEALGTQFSVNAYTNEPFISTTLVEGSVMVTKGTVENILNPGQQAQLTEKDFQIVKVNTDSAVAWKNNEFKFINTPIDAIMRQLERWYDADVEYRDKVTLHLNATIGRDVPVSKLLDIFEETGQVKFKVEEKKIIVMK
jgi:ferric-dicitrate binding protein FerR (iron transport regulator)